MRVEQLRYVEAVARLGSFRRAAEELHISQPALSESVRNLERELGVDLLVRTRTGAHASEEGRELLPHVLAAIEATSVLQHLAQDRHQRGRTLRIATVNAATVGLVAPAIAELRGRHGGTQVEVLMARQDDIHRALAEGRVDLGLVNYLDGETWPAELDTEVLLRGRVSVCLPVGHPLAEHAEIAVEQLLAEPVIAMRAGYVMHRFLQGLAGDREPRIAYATDGAEMGKVLVAEGLGITLLPSFSVEGDPLERAGVITHRPLAGRHPAVLLTLQQRRATLKGLPLRELQRIFVERAGALDAVAA